MDAGSDRRESGRVSHGVIPQAKIKTIKMTFVIVLGMHLSAFSHRAHAPPSLFPPSLLLLNRGPRKLQRVVTFWFLRDTNMLDDSLTGFGIYVDPQSKTRLYIEHDDVKYVIKGNLIFQLTCSRNLALNMICVGFTLLTGLLTKEIACPIGWYNSQ